MQPTIELGQLIADTCQAIAWWERLATAQIVQAAGHARVQTGPFAGLNYDGELLLKGLPRKLLGGYEHELHAQIERGIAAEPARVINIGAAEGYYALGLAMRLPRAEVVTFEADPALRQSCARLAQANDVAGRVQIRGVGTLDELQHLVAPGCWLVVDVEGAEGELLVPDRIPALRGASILLETHEFAWPGLVEELRRRFSATHEIEIIASQPSDPRNYPEFANLAPRDAWWSGVYFEMVFNEFRALGQGWMSLHPKRP